MVKRAFSFLGIVAVAAVAGGAAAWGVASMNDNNLGTEIIDSVQYNNEAVTPTSLDTHFAAFQAEQYPDLTYAAENAVQAVAEELTDTGRILVRESGTEPVVRVMVEAETKEQCQILAERVVNVIREKGHTV